MVVLAVDFLLGTFSFVGQTTMDCPAKAIGSFFEAYDKDVKYSPAIGCDCKPVRRKPLVMIGTWMCAEERPSSNALRRSNASVLLSKHR